MSNYFTQLTYESTLMMSIELAGEPVFAKLIFVSSSLNTENAYIFPGYFDGETITVNQYRIPADPVMVEGFPNDEYQVGVRPEAILLTDNGDDSQRCTVNKVAYMGNMYEVGVTWHDHDILLQLNTSQFDASLADHAYLSINPTGLFLLPFNA